MASLVFCGWSDARFTIQVTHVVLRTLYLVVYYESLFFFLEGLAVCSFNQTLHRNLCMPIGGVGFLVVVVYLGLLLLARALCTTVGCGSMYIHCKVLI